MSRPRAASRGARTPSVEIEPRRRTLPPTVTTPRQQLMRAGRSTPTTATAPEFLSATAATAQTTDGGGSSEQRYARSLAQRKRDASGHAYPAPPGVVVPPVVPVPKPYVPTGNLPSTSVNIAQAFRAATEGYGTIRTGGRREDFGPPTLPPQGEEDRPEEGEQVEQEEEGEDEEDGIVLAEEKLQAVAPPSTGKKRKKNVPKHHSRQQQAGPSSSSSEESELDLQRGKPKRTKVASDDDDYDDHASTHRPRRRRSARPADPTYVPMADPAYRAGDESTTTTDEDTPQRRRRSTKPKARASVGVLSRSSEAIPRGIRDGEVWYGKKRKGRKGARKSAEGFEQEEEEEEEGEGEEEGGQDPSGMDQPHYHPADTRDASFDREQDSAQDEEGDATPPAATYFLRLKSPSPGQPAHEDQQQRGSLRHAVDRHGEARTERAASVDPAFAAFDRSLGHATNGNHPDSYALSVSFDDSGVRGSSYDYSEEERIVQALEAQKTRQLEAQRIQAQRAIRPMRGPEAPGSPFGGMATPRPSTGAYPLTPDAAAAAKSPVSALRKRRLPGPPSMLGAGTAYAAPTDQDGDEADGVGEGRRRGGEWGRRCGNALRPLVELAERARRKAHDPLLDWDRIRKVAAALMLATALMVAVWRYDLLDRLAPNAKSPAAPSSPPFVAPDVPPDSLDGLIARLSDLESAMSRLSSVAESDRQRSSHDRSAISRMASQLEILETSVSVEQSRVSSSLEGVERSVSQQTGDARRAVQGVTEELDSLHGRLKMLADAQESHAQGMDRLEDSVSTVTGEVDTIKRHIAKMEQRFAEATSSERITQLALDAIAQKLPGKIAVLMDKSGRLEIDPAFWRVLRDAFVDQKVVERTVDAKLAALDGSSKRGGLFGSSKEPKPAPIAPGSPTSWNDFLAANEAALRAFVASDLSSRTGPDAFLSKQQFLELLRREIKTLKREFEDKANQNFEDMGREILRKVAQQDDLRRKDQQRSAKQPSGSGPFTIKASDGQNVTAVITSLVDSALLRYSKDVLARPDYALFTSGGRVIRSLTSPSYDPHPASALRSTLAWVTGTKTPRGRPPVTALHSDTSPGACWPFAGQQGQLGIQLSRRVVPTEVTLEHISTDVALDGDVSSAPKDFEVWGIVEGEENLAKVAQYRIDQLAAKRAARAAALEAGAVDAAINAELEDLDPASVPPSANHLLLAVGAYDPSLPSPVQTFPVTPAARQLAVPVQVVVVKVLSNHGEQAYTCLYRVRVSGTTGAQLGTESSA